MANTDRHHRIFLYLVLAYVLAQLLLLAALKALVFPDVASMSGHLAWVCTIGDWLLAATVAYLAFVIATLLLANRQVPLSRSFTLLIGCTLLPFFPVGTALGIYGIIASDQMRHDHTTSG